MFGWYRHTTASEKRAFWSCKIGYVLDAMDTQFLSFVIPTLIATWGITRGDAGLIGTVTLLSSALGGWVAGILSDRIGRVKTLQITILWFAVFTLACALAQNFFAAAMGARPDGSRLRRRMDGGRGADRRSHPPA